MTSEQHPPVGKGWLSSLRSTEKWRRRRELFQEVQGLSTGTWLMYTTLAATTSFTLPCAHSLLLSILCSQTLFTDMWHMYTTLAATTSFTLPCAHSLLLSVRFHICCSHALGTCTSQRQPPPQSRCPVHTACCCQYDFRSVVCRHLADWHHTGSHHLVHLALCIHAFQRMTCPFASWQAASWLN